MDQYYYSHFIFLASNSQKTTSLWVQDKNVFDHTQSNKGGKKFKNYFILRNLFWNNGFNKEPDYPSWVRNFAVCVCTCVCTYQCIAYRACHVKRNPGHSTNAWKQWKHFTGSQTNCGSTSRIYYNHKLHTVVPIVFSWFLPVNGWLLEHTSNTFISVFIENLN